MTETIATAAGGCTVWQLLCGEGPVPKALAKFIDTIGDQLGKGIQLGNDWLEAKKLASTHLTEANSEIAIDILKAKASHDSKLFKLKSQAERAVAWHDIQQQRKFQNVEQVLSYASDELRNSPDVEVSDKKVDPDWTSQCLNHVQDVSNEEMQRLWGKLLSGEIKQPGSFSLRTLNAVKTMSKEDGDTFSRLCSVVWRNNEGPDMWALTNREWVHNPVLNNPSPITFNYADCLAMQEAGLIDIADTYSTIWMSPSGFFLKYFDDRYHFQDMVLQEDRTQLNSGTFMLTQSGKELAQIAEGVRSTEYLEAILNNYREQGWIINRARLINQNQVELLTEL